MALPVLVLLPGALEAGPRTVIEQEPNVFDGT